MIQEAKGNGEGKRGVTKKSQDRGDHVMMDAFVIVNATARQDSLKRNSKKPSEKCAQ